ncbi:hypothetical protein D3C73_971430 [compost metagenome]
MPSSPESSSNPVQVPKEEVSFGLKGNTEAVDQPETGAVSPVPKELEIKPTANVTSKVNEPSVTDAPIVGTESKSLKNEASSSNSLALNDESVNSSSDATRSMALKSLAPVQMTSTDGTYEALVKDQKIIIQTTAKHELVMESKQTWKSTDTVTLLSWSKDDKLTYEVTSDSKTQTWVIDLKAKSEAVTNPK